MKKMWFVFASFVLVLTGCGSKEVSDKEIETKVKDLGYEIEYSRMENDGEDDYDIILFGNDDQKLFYNTSTSWGIFTSDSTVYINDQRGLSTGTCIYDLKKDKAEKYFTCSKSDISSIKKAEKQFHSALEEIGITEKQFKRFSKYEIKKEK